MYVVQTAEQKTGAVGYLARGRVVWLRKHATRYSSPSAAQHAVRRHTYRNPHTHTYEVLPEGRPRRIVLLEGGWAYVE